ncbi:MAG: preprotein translocase subunit SecY [Pseudomonadota bacterium]
MASAAEQLASNINFSAFAKATELQQRILFTLLALVVYRIGTYIPLPGIDPAVIIRSYEQPGTMGILGMLDMFAGGALGRSAIFSLNIMPYISASIIMQLMTTVSPTLEQLKKEGEQGRKKMNQYTRYLTVALASVQAYAAAAFLQSSGFVNEGATLFIPSTVITLVGGTIFLMWLGERITARGVGNGISLLIFAGIIAELPRNLFQILAQGEQIGGVVIVLFLLLLIGLFAFIVFMERAQRRILIQYPKRQVGNRMYGGESSHLPLKLNTAGVIPPIFATSILLLPATMIGFSAQGGGPEWLQTTAAYLGHGSWTYMLLLSAGIIFFCFFYTAIVFNPEDTADNLKKYGGFVPGIRPGKKTAEYLDYVLTRLTVVGALYLTFVCLVPEFLYASRSGIPVQFGGTSLLIVVTVTMDTVAQIQSHLLAHQYEGLIKKAKLRGSKR